MKVAKVSAVIVTLSATLFGPRGIHAIIQKITKHFYCHGRKRHRTVVTYCKMCEMLTAMANFLQREMQISVFIHTIPITEKKFLDTYAILENLLSLNISTFIFKDL